jgi:hypothetical protein
MPRYCKPNGPYTPMVEFYPERVEGATASTSTPSS